MKAKDISDAGMKNIVYETIKSAVNEWIKSAVYLYKETGVNPLKMNWSFDERFRCNKKVISRVKSIRDTESFFRGETYEFYATTIDCYVDPNRLLNELNKRALEIVFK